MKQLSIITLAVLAFFFVCFSRQKENGIYDYSCDYCIDSIWGEFKNDTVRENGMIHYKHGVTVSKWLLYKIDSGKYHYYRIYSYDCADGYINENDAPFMITEDKKDTVRLNMRNCLVNHMEQQDCIAHCLMDGAKVTDTVPTVMEMWYGGEGEIESWKSYWIGWRIVRNSDTVYRKK